MADRLIVRDCCQAIGTSDLAVGTNPISGIFRNVVNAVAGHFGVSPDDIVSSRRTRAILPARHAAAYLASKVTGLPSHVIGKQLGGRDRTLIELYCRSAILRMTHDAAFEYLLESSERQLQVFDDRTA